MKLNSKRSFFVKREITIKTKSNDLLNLNFKRNYLKQIKEFEHSEEEKIKNTVDKNSICRRDQHSMFVTRKQLSILWSFLHKSF